MSIRGVFILSKNDTPACSVCNGKSYFKFCTEWTYQQPLPTSFIASDRFIPQLVVISPCRVGRPLILHVFSLGGFFFFTEILKQIVAASTDFWEIFHVSSFKQVV